MVKCENGRVVLEGNANQTEAQLDEMISDIKKEIMNLLFGKEEKQ